MVYAAELDAALTAMRTREIAVVITDLDASQAKLATLLRMLKRENPQLLAIVIAAAADSELVIELINTAQIFRFLSKPVNVRSLKNHLHAALQRYKTPG